MDVLLNLFFVAAWALVGAGLLYWAVLYLTVKNVRWAGSVAGAALLAFLLGAAIHPLASDQKHKPLLVVQPNFSSGPLARLQQSSQPTVASMDGVGYSGGLPPTATDSPPISLNYAGSVSLGMAGSLVIRGWAGDARARVPARSVFAIFDGRIRVGGRLKSGIDRPDVAAAFHNPRFLRTGFLLTVPVLGLVPGDHTVQLGVITSDGKYFTILPQQFTFAVKD